jgi:hypothetical protein
MAFLMARNAALARSPTYMKQYLFNTGIQAILSNSLSTQPGDRNLLVNNGQRAVQASSTTGVVAQSIDDPSFDPQLLDGQDVAANSKPNPEIEGLQVSQLRRRRARPV